MSSAPGHPIKISTLRHDHLAEDASVTRRMLIESTCTEQCEASYEGRQFGSLHVFSMVLGASSLLIEDSFGILGPVWQINFVPYFKQSICQKINRFTGTVINPLQNYVIIFLLKF